MNWDFLTPFGNAIITNTSPEMNNRTKTFPVTLFNPEKWQDDKFCASRNF
jgi:hypothetical protein